jgi:hypothetical protein
MEDKILKQIESRSQEPESSKTVTTVSGCWFLVTDSVFAPDLPEYPDFPGYQKKSGISGAQSHYSLAPDLPDCNDS